MQYENAAGKQSKDDRSDSGPPQSPTSYQQHISHDLADVYAICRFEIPMMNLLNPPSFSLIQGSPAQWLHGYDDFNQNWTKTLWIGEYLDEAKRKLEDIVLQWREETKYTLESIGTMEYRGYAGLLKREGEFRGKVHIEGTFRVA